MEVKSVPFEYSFSAGTTAVGTSVVLIAKAPTDALGGGITVLDAFVMSPDTIATGSAPTVRILRYSSGAVVEGTIGSQTAGTGGWTAGTPKTFTISDPFVDAGEYIAIEFAGTAANAGTAYTQGIHLVGAINVQMGQ